MNTCPHCSSDQYSVNVTCANCGVIYKALPNWTGLTDEERDHLAGVHLYASPYQITTWIEGVDNFAQAIEKLLKEKNT